MNFGELNILVKYISNRVDQLKFQELMYPRYNDPKYIMNLWPSFRNNPTMFIITKKYKFV